MSASKILTINDTRYKWWVLATALVAQTTAAIATQGLGALAGFVQMGLRLTNGEVGILSAAVGVVPIIGLLAVGEWLDRATARIVIGVGAAIMGVSMALIGITHTFGGLLVCLVFVGAGYSTAQPGGSKAVLHWFPASKRGLAMGVRQAGLPLGGAVAAALFPGIASAAGWKTAFIVGAAIIVIGGIPFCAIYRDPGLMTTDARSRGHARPLRHARSLLAIPAFRQAVFAGVVLVSAQSVTLIFLILFLRQTAHIPFTTGALYLLVMQLAGSAGRIVLAAWSDHVRHGRSVIVAVAVVGTMVGIIGLGAYPVVGVPALLFAIVAWLGFFGFGWYGPWVTWISELAPQSRAGATLGLAMAFNQVGIVVAPVAFGFLTDITGGYQIPGIILMVALSCYLVFSTRRRRHHGN